MMRTRMDFIFWKRRTEIFLQLSFKENLYENKYKAFDIYRETEMLSRRGFLRVFLLRFRFQFYCSCFNYIMTSITLLSIPAQENVYKSFENVSVRFCTDQKDVAKNVYEVDQELGGGELSLSACPSVGKRQGCG